MFLNPHTRETEAMPFPSKKKAGGCDSESENCVCAEGDLTAVDILHSPVCHGGSPAAGDRRIPAPGYPAHR